jgi:hypothetical protein
MPLTQVPPALLTSTTGTGSTVVLSASPTFTGTITTPGVTFSDASSQTAAASPYVLKNRIINGAMVINQRNTSVTSDAYTVDRFKYGSTQSSKATVAQSTIAPTGFSNSLGVTSSSAYSVISSDVFGIFQYIEGNNFYDLNWGTANAQTVTLSFWVRSSLTGTFGGAILNYAGTRSYPFSYTISAANTWEQKSVTIAGDTGGTWVGATNAGAAIISFGLGSGSTYSGTAGSWSTNQYYQPTGSTSVVGTNGATWYVTGVQLEIGTSATPFERRLYNQELANCQRYFQYVPFTGTAVSVGEMNAAGMFRVEMRTAPAINTVLKNTPSYIDGSSNNLFRVGVGNVSVGAASIASGFVNTNGFIQLYTTSGLTTAAPANVYSGSAMMSAEL